MKDQLKAQLKTAFTEFPYCLVTYLTLGGMVTLLVVNWQEHLRFIGK